MTARALLVSNGLLLFSAVLGASGGGPVAVRRTEGSVQRSLVLKTLEGATIADGDLTQVARGTRVTTRVIFRFKDGSTQDETVVFSQDGQFRLIEDHLVQKGPSFPRTLDMSINSDAGTVSVHYVDDGEQKEATEHMKLPSDLANGLVPILLKNVTPKTLPASFSYVAATPRPRLVKLALTTAGQERFSTAGETGLATHYVLKVEIGGLSGLLAPLVGKQPPDSHVWILSGEAPAFVKSEQQLYVGGPVWRIEAVAAPGPS